jgi:hypothetical protein
MVQSDRLVFIISIRAKEEADYVMRITHLPEQYTQEKFAGKLPRFGTLTLFFRTHRRRNIHRIQTKK